MNSTTEGKGVALDWDATIGGRASPPPPKANPVAESQASDETIMKHLHALLRTPIDAYNQTPIIEKTTPRADKPQIVTLDTLLSIPPKPIDAIIEGCFDSGTKIELIAPSKCRKSFFVIDLALHVAAGLDFVGLEIPKPRKVVYVNLELKEDSVKRRFIGRMKGYGIQLEDLHERLSIMNARSNGEWVRNNIAAKIKEAKPDLLILDPRYKLMLPKENENTGEGLAGILQLQDEIAETGIAVLMVAHDAKGNAGERADRDRGAGSSWAGRDVDCRFSLTPHANDPEDMVVLSFMVRDFPPKADITLNHGETGWTVSDEAPIKETSYSKKAAEKKATTKTLKDHRPALLELLAEEGKALKVTLLTSRLSESQGVGLAKARSVIEDAVAAGVVELFDQLQPRSKWIGTPKQIEEHKSPKLKV